VQRYVLTERGKLLVAMLIVLLLVLPAIIIFVRSSPETNNWDEPVPKSTPDLIQLLPAAPENSNSDSNNPVNIDLDAGNMFFMFSPETQTTLDSNTTSAIGQLLTSPKNTDTSKIAVEIPQLSDDEAAVLTTAITNALSTHGVPLTDVVFFVYQPDQDIKTYKINIAFQSAS